MSGMIKGPTYAQRAQARSRTVTHTLEGSPTANIEHLLTLAATYAGDGGLHTAKSVAQEAIEAIEVEIKRRAAFVASITPEQVAGAVIANRVGRRNKLPSWHPMSSPTPPPTTPSRKRK